MSLTEVGYGFVVENASPRKAIAVMSTEMLELTDSVTLSRFQEEVRMQGDPPLDCYVCAQDDISLGALLSWREPLDVREYRDYEARFEINPVDVLFGSVLSEHNVSLAGIDREEAVRILMSDITKDTMHRRLIVEGDDGFLSLAIGPVGMLGYVDPMRRHWQGRTGLSFAYLEKHGCVFDYDRYGWGSGRLCH